jgi:hypothetical protein
MFRRVRCTGAMLLPVLTLATLLVFSARAQAEIPAPPEGHADPIEGADDQEPPARNAGEAQTTALPSDGERPAEARTPISEGSKNSSQKPERPGPGDHVPPPATAAETDDAPARSIENLSGWFFFGLYGGVAIRPDLTWQSSGYGSEGNPGALPLSGTHLGWGIRAGLVRELSDRFGLEFALQYFRAGISSAHSGTLVIPKGSALSFTNLDVLLHVLPKADLPLSIYGLLAIGVHQDSLGDAISDGEKKIPKSRTGAAFGVGLGVRYFPLAHVSFDLQVRYEIVGFGSSTPCGEYTSDGKACYLDTSKEEDHFYGATLILLGPVATFR